MDSSVPLQLHRSSILRLHPDRPLVAHPKFHRKLSDQQNWGENFSHLCAVYWSLRSQREAVTAKQLQRKEVVQLGHIQTLRDDRLLHRTRPLRLMSVCLHS